MDALEAEKHMLSHYRSVHGDCTGAHLESEAEFYLHRVRPEVRTVRREVRTTRRGVNVWMDPDPIRPKTSKEGGGTSKILKRKLKKWNMSSAYNTSEARDGGSQEQVPGHVSRPCLSREHRHSMDLIRQR